MYLDDNRDHVLLADLCRRGTVTRLRIDGRFEKRDIRSVTRAKWLTELSIDTAAMTADDIRSMRTQLPDCHIYIRVMEPPKPAK